LIVEHVDFWAVPVTDMERSISFYRDTLDLPQTGEGGFPEFKLGDNGFLYLLNMEAIGAQFRAPHDAEFNGDVLDTGVCHMAFFGDPDGNQLVLHRRYAAHDTTAQES
jgi:predicted enzyme related to lactoylglutathione lyase